MTYTCLFFPLFVLGLKAYDVLERIPALDRNDLQKLPAGVIDFYEVKAKQMGSCQSKAVRRWYMWRHVMTCFSKFSQTKMEHGGKFGDGTEDLAVFETWLVKMALSEKRACHVSFLKRDGAER